MPEQLARGWRARKQSRRREPRSLAERLPRININDLELPRNHDTVIAPWISFRYPFISGVKLRAHMVEFFHSERIQTFTLKWIRTGFGYPRASFICGCGRPAISLYFRLGNLACRRCSNAIYASQACSKRGRKALQTHRIRQFLNLGLGITNKTRQRLQARPSTQLRSKRITGGALLPLVNYQVQALPLWR